MRYNLPNILTVSRVPAMFAIVALMYGEFRWGATIAFWLFIAAALSDWLDGKLARASGQVSTFGRFMDAVIDKVMVIGLMVALVNGGYFAGWRTTAMLCVLGVIGREFLISGLRMVAASKGMVVEADTSGKVKTFLQLNAIGWLLGWKMFMVDFGDVGSAVLNRGVHTMGLVFFAGSVVLALTSGWTYFRKHGHVVRD
ncbi:MAG: CDP-diacylglycerol--glycerol-3-phosphate 3-phosphatidyltransferase [Opitutaceae bacterium]|nr:CDP-diacylglycerol--glycerol-3-phosphate 3-phosphatidyltransferase [Opitutaceae bacterium]